MLGSYEIPQTPRLPSEARSPHPQRAPATRQAAVRPLLIRGSSPEVTPRTPSLQVAPRPPSYRPLSRGGPEGAHECARHLGLPARPLPQRTFQEPADTGTLRAALERLLPRLRVLTTTESCADTLEELGPSAAGPAERPCIAGRCRPLRAEVQP